MADIIQFANQEGVQNELQDEEEQMYAYLEAERIQAQSEQELKNLYEEGASYGHPSYWKYGLLFSLAIIIDIADLADLSGIGAIVGRSISFLLSAVIFFIFWVTNTKFKKAQNYIDTLEERISVIQSNIAHATRLTVRTAKILRRVPGMRGVSRKALRTMVKIRRFGRKNPITKLVITAVLNLIPFLSIFVLMTVGVYLSYLDEKKTFRNAGEAATDAVDQTLGDEQSLEAA